MLMKKISQILKEVVILLLRWSLPNRQIRDLKLEDQVQLERSHRRRQLLMQEMVGTRLLSTPKIKKSLAAKRYSMQLRRMIDPRQLQASQTDVKPK